MKLLVYPKELHKFSKTDSKIIQFFFENSDEEYNISELADELEVNQANVSKRVRSLQDLDSLPLVTRRQEDKKIVKLNQDSVQDR